MLKLTHDKLSCGLETFHNGDIDVLKI